MKRLLVIALSVILIFVTSGCENLYYGKRPFDYGAATWVCEEPSAWFVVNPDDEEYYYPKGEIVVDNQTQQVGFRFIVGTNEVFIDLYNSKIDRYKEKLEGKCKFLPEKFVIKIEKDRDKLFYGKYDELVFIRMLAEEE